MNRKQWTRKQWKIIKQWTRKDLMEEIDRLGLNRQEIIDERNHWRDLYYSDARKNTEVLGK